MIKQKPELEGQLDKLDYNEYKEKLQKDIVDAKIAKGTFKEKDPKKLEGLQTRQDMFINKLMTRLNMFEKVYNDPVGANKKLEELKKEMLDLKPASNAQPTESGSKTDDNQKNIETQVSKLTQRLDNLEKQVTVLMGKAKGTS